MSTSGAAAPNRLTNESSGTQNQKNRKISDAANETAMTHSAGAEPNQGVSVVAERKSGAALQRPAGRLWRGFFAEGRGGYAACWPCSQHQVLAAVFILASMNECSVKFASLMAICETKFAQNIYFV
ncbi:hypothetical protein [Acidovorax carolinensis]|uniref:hypothetical protein n=1 Tax=Acidovorax carolinensis TaxID=553814 RepID=UPI0012FFC1FB|nr:hypothetical protein [Acidovorax carolinensis]